MIVIIRPATPTSPPAVTVIAHAERDAPRWHSLGSAPPAAIRRAGRILPAHPLLRALWLALQCLPPARPWSRRWPCRWIVRLARPPATLGPFAARAEAAAAEENALATDLTGQHTA